MNKLITVSTVANASPVQLLCITYEIFLHHMEEAIKGSDEKRQERITQGVEVIKTLVEDLNFESPMAPELFRLYVYIQGVLLGYRVTDEKLEHVYEIMERIYKAFLEIGEQQELSSASMKNIETIYAGMTYGKNDLNEIVIGDNNRGFKA